MKYEYKTSAAYRGYGWIEPLTDPEDSLIEDYVARRICDELNSMQAEITSLRAALEQAQEDAERYRWLRDSDMFDPESQPDSLKNAFARYTGPRLDAAIDEAMEKEASNG